MSNNVSNNPNLQRVLQQAEDTTTQGSGFAAQALAGVTEALTGPLKLLGAVGGMLMGVLGSCGGGCGGI